MKKKLLFCAYILLNLLGCSWKTKDPIPQKELKIQNVYSINPTIKTTPIKGMINSFVMWIHPKFPQKSLIFYHSSFKHTSYITALSVEGNLIYNKKINCKVQSIKMDVGYGLNFKDKTTDFIVISDGNTVQLLTIDPSSSNLKELSLMKLKNKISKEIIKTGEKNELRGLALYKRPSDHKFFLILSTESLDQYQLSIDNNSQIHLKQMRQIKNVGSGTLVVDEALGYLYCHTNHDIRKYHVDPNHKEANKELALFAKMSIDRILYQKLRAGIGLYIKYDNTGYIVGTEPSIDGSVQYVLYKREGEKGYPNDHRRIIKAANDKELIYKSVENDRDLFITSMYLGKKFPTGLMIVKSPDFKSLYIYNWKDISVIGSPNLEYRL